jgi:hypothetical protein
MKTEYDITVNVFDNGDFNKLGTKVSLRSFLNDKFIPYSEIYISNDSVNDYVKIISIEVVNVQAVVGYCLFLLAATSINID